MQLRIDNDQAMADVQEKFNECFPHLKLEFYKKRHKQQHASLEIDRIKENRKIGEIRKKQNAGIMEIKSWENTGDVEQHFKDEFGLYVQIFRKENNNWIQSEKSDKLTLAEQSELAAVYPVSRR